MKKLVSNTILIIAILLLIFVSAHKKQMRLNHITSVLSPAEAAVLHIWSMKEADFRLEPGSVDAVQSVNIRGQILILIQYDGFQIGSGARRCEMVAVVKKDIFHRWKVNDGAGLCHHIVELSDSVPITVVGSSSNLALLDGGYSAVHGYVWDPEIAKIALTWNDGLEQEAVIQGSTYLAARDGHFMLQQIETWNDQGQLVFSARPGTIPQPTNHSRKAGNK